MSAWELASISTTTQDELRQALLQEDDPRAPSKTLWSLSKACWEGDLEVVQRLVRAGAKIHHRRSSAILVAVGRGHADVTQYLLIEEQERIAHLKYRTEHLQEAILQARHTDAARLAEVQSSIEDAKANKNNALFISIRKGDLHLARTLVEHGAEVNSHAGGRTPLRMAARYGHLSIVEFLIDRGLCTTSDLSKATTIAAAQGFVEITKTIKKSRPGLANPEALKAAAGNGHARLVKLLLETNGGLSHNLLEPRHYSRALYAASAGGHLEVVEILEQAGADVNACVGAEENTALQAAIQNDHEPIVSFLVAHGAKENSKTPLHDTSMETAAKFGSIQTIEALLKAREPDIVQTSIRAAANEGQIALLDRLLSKASMSRHGLADKEADTTWEHREQIANDLLGQAVGRGWEQIVELLISKRSVKDHIHGYTPLVFDATRHGWTAIVQLFLEAGVDVDQPLFSELGSPLTTLLHTAVSGGHEDTVRLLLEHNADPDIAHAGKKLPLLLACRRGYAGIAKLLLEHGASVWKLSKGKSVEYYAEMSQNANLIRLIAQHQSPMSQYRDVRNEIGPPLAMFGGVWSDFVRKETCPACHEIASNLWPIANELQQSDEKATFQGFELPLKLVQRGAGFGCQFCRFLFWCAPQWKKTHFKRDSLLWAVMTRTEKRKKRIIIRIRGRQSQPFHALSESSSLRIASWLKSCKTHHGPCTSEFNTSFRPTRLVDIQGWRSGGHLRLFCVEANAAQIMPYIALSHRWNENVSLTSTTTSNFAERLHDIDAKSLPHTFQHTFAVANTLQIQYVWIDSLCIIQDSTDDWSKESALMSEVYRNAYCTISANRHDAGEHGLFHSDLGSLAIEFALKTKHDQLELHQRGSIQQHWREAIQAAPLHVRGWCLQEREMSPRIIHWTEQEIAWECRVAKATESWPEQMNVDWSQLDARDRRAWDGLEDMDMVAIYDGWHRTVERYTKMHLTDERDTLPALSGLANVIHSRTQSGYRAGLWVGDLRRCLAWHSIEREQSAKRPHYRHKRFIAPSWSWAAIHGSVQYSISMDSIYVPPVPLIDDGIAVIKHHETSLSSLDEYGTLSSGELHLYGPVVWAVSSSARDRYDYAELRCIPGQEAIVCCFDVQTERYDYSLVMCIVLFADLSDYDGNVAVDASGVGLALVPVDGRVNTFRRVGYVELLDMSLFRRAPKQDIVIV